MYTSRFESGLYLAVRPVNSLHHDPAWLGLQQGHPPLKPPGQGTPYQQMRTFLGEDRDYVVVRRCVEEKVFDRQWSCFGILIGNDLPRRELQTYS